MTISKRSDGVFCVDGIPAETKHLEVRLDGEKQSFVQGASEEQGYVDMLVVHRDRNGQPRAVAGLDGRPITQRLRGKVRILDRSQILMP